MTDGSTLGQFRRPKKKESPRQTQTVVNTETPETPVVENPELGAMARYKSGQTTSEAMPQSTNTTPETQTTTSPIDVKKLEEEVVANSANTFGTTTPKSGVEYLDSLYNELKPMTAEEEERRKRGAMSASAIAHLGNMMGALGNVINVNKGAVSQTSPTVKSPDITSFEEKVRKQREAHADRLYKIDALRRQQDKEDWTRKQAEAEFELKKQTAKYNNALNALKMQVEQGKLTAQEYDNEIKKINAQFASHLKQAELNRTNAQTRASEASATASLARARSYDDNKGKYFAEDKNGKVHYFDEYEEAEEFGLANGTWQYDTYDEVTTEESVDNEGDKTTTTRTTTKRGKGHPRTSKKSPTAGNNNKKKSPTA